MESTMLANINQLPNEVLEIILSNVPHPDLYRYVSRKWNSIGSLLCRRQHIELQFFDSDSQDIRTSDIIARFKDVENSPWSSITVRKQYLDQVHIEQILVVFGHHIKRFTIERSYDHNAIIQYLPNVNTLYFDFSRSENEPEPIALLTTHPRRLKSLEMKFSDKFAFDFLKDIVVHTRSSLQSVSLDLTSRYYDVPEFADELASLLIGIASISLKLKRLDLIPPSYLANGLRIRKLQYQLASFYPQVVDLSAISRLLSDVSPTLEEMSIACYSNLDVQPSLSLPHLPKLTKLQLIHQITHPEPTPIPLSLDFIVPFTGNEFPALEFVELRYSKRLDLFTGAEFPSVRVLTFLEDDSPGGNDSLAEWNRVFPNLQTLVSEPSQQELLYIFTNMPLLTGLDLVLSKSWSDELSDILTGTLSESAVTTRASSTSRSRGVEGTLRPSLRDMKELKSLVLMFPQNLRKWTVGQTLLQLQPLESLILWNLKVPKALLKKLEQRHAFVEVSNEGEDD